MREHQERKITVLDETRSTQKKIKHNMFMKHVFVKYSYDVPKFFDVNVIICIIFFCNYIVEKRTVIFWLIKDTFHHKYL